MVESHRGAGQRLDAGPRHGEPRASQAQEYVARHLERNGVTAAGAQGYFQSVPLRQLRLQPQQSHATLTRGGNTETLRWLQQISVQPQTGLPSVIAGDLVFVGSDNGASLETAGKIVVRLNPVFGVPGPALPPPPERAAAVIGIDSAIGPEPSRWPVQTAVSMVLADAALPAAPASGRMTLRFNPSFADLLFDRSGHTYAELVDSAAAGRPVPSFALNASMRLAPSFHHACIRQCDRRPARHRPVARRSAPRAHRAQRQHHSAATASIRPAPRATALVVGRGARPRERVCGHRVSQRRLDGRSRRSRSIVSGELCADWAASRFLVNSNSVRAMSSPGLTHTALRMCRSRRERVHRSG